MGWSHEPLYRLSSLPRRSRGIYGSGHQPVSMVFGPVSTLLNFVGPFIIPVALFVGGIIGYLVLRWLSQRYTTS
jgi:hypothetical protein